MSSVFKPEIDIEDATRFAYLLRVWCVLDASCPLVAQGIYHTEHRRRMADMDDGSLRPYLYLCIALSCLSIVGIAAAFALDLLQPPPMTDAARVEKMRLTAAVQCTKATQQHIVHAAGVVKELLAEPNADWRGMEKQRLQQSLDALAERGHAASAILEEGKEMQRQSR
jgi:hypothetical protein